MRVLIITGIFPPDIGGPATYVPKVATYLAERGHPVHVITLSDSPGSTTDVTYAFQLTRIPRALPLLARAWLTCRAILHAARQADCIFVNGLYTHAAIVLSLLRRRYVAKIVGDPAWERSVGREVFSGDIESFQSAPLTLSGRIFRWMRTQAIQRAETVIVPSEYLKRLVTCWGVKPERIIVIRNGTRLSARAKGSPGTLQPPFSLITVARLVPWKGMSEIVQCMAQLPDCRLAIVGDGPQRRELEAQVDALELRERVNFWGKVSASKVVELFSQAHLFLLNSSYEGLPHIVLEAAAAGVPALVKDRGGSSEAILNAQTGFLYDNLTPPVIQETLERIQQPKFGEAFFRSTKELLASFDESRMLERTAEILIGAVTDSQQPSSTLKSNAVISL